MEATWADRTWHWLNEPPHWQIDEHGALHATSAAHSDFWRLTHDGAVRDSGHLYATSIEGDFTLTVALEGAFASLYDQAGLMVRVDDTQWLKAGLEYVDGAPRICAVYTRETSDWSVGPAFNSRRFWLQARRAAGTVEVSWSSDGSVFQLFRQCTLAQDPLLAGPFCCSPGQGFETIFHSVSLRDLR